MLQTHPALELLHHGPICQGVQEPQLWLEVHGVIFLGVVQEQGTAVSVLHHAEGTIMELLAWRVPARSRPASLTPTSTVPWDITSTHATPRASLPSTGHQYRL